MLRRASRGPTSLIVLLAMLLVVTHLARGTAAAVPRGEPLSLRSYIGVVRTARDLLRETGSRAQRAAAAARAAALLRGAGVVAMPRGGSVAPDNTAVLADLAAVPPRLHAARIRLAALLAALEEATRGHSVQDDRGALAQVFGQPPFTTAGPETSIVEYLWLVLVRWVAGLLAGLFPQNSYAAGNTALILLLSAAALVMATLIVGGSRGLFHTLVPAAATAGDPLHPEARLDGPAARQLAAHAAERAEYRAALRFAFLAILLDLDDRGLVRFDPAAADRDLIGQARRRSGALGDLLARAAQDFETVWYGHRACGEAEYAAMNGLARRIQETKGGDGSEDIP